MSLPVVQTSCTACGSQLAYLPGTRALRCVSCGATVEFGPDLKTKLPRHDVATWRDGLVGSGTSAVLRCEACGGETASRGLSDACVFCGSHLTAAPGAAFDLEPDGVVPFRVDRAGAAQALLDWSRMSRLFAQRGFTPDQVAESFVPAYYPVWVLDARSTSAYSGRRGDERRVGSQETRRTVVDWTDVTGTVRVKHSARVPAGGVDDELARSVRSGTRDGVVPFRREFLVGFTTLPVTLSPEAAFASRADSFAADVRSEIEDAIGGDRNEISSAETTYERARFRLVLVPVWVLTFMYEGKPWRIRVDGVEGVATGDYPVDRKKQRLVVGLVAAAVVAAPFVVGWLLSALGRLAG
ncbi:hypothetical protein [Sanguibacter massiliensis]|uniref:hypothetical protein n=1 Tax=Sanguibacter massiliensis TaxID=1973217 RepID=UPI000C821FB0|nr:hypothetical protein [Sanguibacter massiliensis]